MMLIEGPVPQRSADLAAKNVSSDPYMHRMDMACYGQQVAEEIVGYGPESSYLDKLLWRMIAQDREWNWRIVAVSA